MTSLYLEKNTSLSGRITGLPASKSVSNRVLILDALSGFQSQISNLSEARDTLLMKELIKSSEKEINVMDAGTTMRFLTAYYAISGFNKILTGTERMKERPIHPLVDALRVIGAEIVYLEKEGFPPLEIKGFSGQKNKFVSVPGNLSSQYISALMMIGPSLPSGIEIELTGHIGSRPYIKMTEAIINMFGGKILFEQNHISILPDSLIPVNYAIEPDWSAASYWFSFSALANESHLTLPGNFKNSFQGDQVISEIGTRLGIKSGRSENELILEKTDHKELFEWNFSDCPDLAQTVVPLCALKGIRGKFAGLESLRIKETDRILALQQELDQVGASLNEETSGLWILKPASKHPAEASIKTYHDHRMAMGFAPWATIMNVRIEDKMVINKSYPRFWEDMIKLGFRITES